MGIDTMIPADRDAVLRGWAMRCLFPLFLVSYIFGQVRPTALLNAIGQISSILTILTSVTVLLTTLPNSLWPGFFLGGILILRGARFAAIDSTFLYLAYTVALAAWSSAAGALIVIRRPGLVERQFAYFWAFSAPLMLLQILGVPWTQAWRTDMAPVALGFTQVPTLFVRAGEVVITTFQSRPAGVFWASNAASIVLTFGLAFHYGRLRRPGRIDWTDVVLLAVVVLAMAKIVFVALGILWLARAVAGPDSRRHVAVSAGLLGLMLLVYWILFPGLFAANLSWEAALYDLEIRVAELLVATGVPVLVRLTTWLPADVILSLGVGVQSGYTAILQQARTLLPTLVVSIPYAWLAFKTLRRFDPNLKREVAAVAVAAILTPAITSPLISAIYWFLAGAAILPIWQLADPAFCRESN
jgi:hypothetical protein